MTDPARDSTWVRDQHDAAARQLRPVFAELREMLGHEAEVHAPEIWPVVSAAMERRVHAWCACSASLTPPPLMCNLSAGWMACPACMREFETELRSLPGDDGRCDLCERPSSWFREGAIQAGPALILWNMCRACSKRWLPLAPVRT